MVTLDPRTPVLVGFATAEQRQAAPAETLDAAGLMIEAARATVPRAAIEAALPKVDWVGATEGLSPYPDPARLVAEAIGAMGAHTVLAKVGVMQQTLISRACSLVQSGDVTLALVVGGEARYREVRAKAAGEQAPLAPQETGTRPDEVLTPDAELVLRCEVDAGLRGAVAYYALIESERRYRKGQTIDQHRRQLGELYARFSEIAAGNPHAARRDSYSADYLSAPSKDNPLLAFPYTKRMVSTWTVDQAAALLFCTAATAERLGVAPERWIFPVIAVESNHMVPVTARSSLTQPEAVRAMARRCLQVSGVDPSTIDLLDLYSCFPVAVTVAAAGLDVADGRDLTMTGGMSFAGGPFNNYVFQALCRGAELLLEGAGASALVSCVSGLYTKQGFTIMATDPPATPFSVEDVTAEVALLEPARPVDDRPTGTGTIAAATVLFEGGEPERAVAVIDMPAGTRTLARSMDPAVMRASMAVEPIGRSVSVADGQFVLTEPIDDDRRQS